MNSPTTTSASAALSAAPDDLSLPTASPGVRLRRHLPQDAEAIWAMCQDPEVQRWTTVPVPYEESDAAGFLEAVRRGWREGTTATFALEVDGRFAGSLDVRLNGAGGAEVGFGLAPWARGRGAMSAALRTALLWSFDVLGLQVVHWRAHVGNWGSRRVAWACGFRHEGEVRGLLVQRGELRDAWIASVRRGEPLAPQHPWLVATTLEDGAVRLRPFRESDAHRVAEACGDPESQRWLPRLPAPYTLEHALDYVRSREEEHAAGRGIYWCVADAATDVCVGSLGVMQPDDGSAEVGYWTHPEARGRGVMSRAVRLAAAHVLAELAGGAPAAAAAGTVGFPALARLDLRAAVDNEASRRVATAAGFREVGLEHAAEADRDGRRRDLVRYERIR